MNRKKAFGVCVALVLGACRSSNRETGQSVKADREQAPQEHAAGDGLIRIDPEMLRDLRITTSPVEARSGVEEASMLGDLRVNQDAYVEVAPPITAQVVRILVAANASVRSGQPLANLRSVDVGRARSEYLSAQAQARLAEETLQRKRNLAADRIVAEREVQEALAQASSAQASLRAAAVALSAVGVSPDDIGSVADAGMFVLRTPIAGTVIERSAVVGQSAEPGQALFKVANLSTLWVVVHAFERDAVRVQRGASARITLPALPGRSFAGRVTMIGSQVEADSRTIPLRVELPNTDSMLRPGMSATVAVAVGEKGDAILSVPSASLQRIGGDWVVFVPRGPGAFQVRPVGRGRDLGGEIEVLSGLRGGELVVVDGSFVLKAEAEKSRGDGESHDHEESR